MSFAPDHGEFCGRSDRAAVHAPGSLRMVATPDALERREAKQERRLDNPDKPQGNRFAYFMVRIHDGEGGSHDGPSGMLERLGSGRKESFSGAEELIRLLTDAPKGASNMRAERETGNA